MKIARFVNPENTINFGGQVFGNHNITPSAYEAIKATIGQEAADKLIVVEDIAEPTAKKPAPEKGVGG